MDIYDILAAATLPAVGLIIAIPFVISAFASNVPSKGSRAGNLKDLAEKLGLKYTPEDKRSAWQKMSNYKKRENIIEGDYKGKTILIYDYYTTTNFTSHYGNDLKRYTIVNGVYLEADLSPEEIESIITNSATSPQKIIFSPEQVADLDELTAPNDARIVNFNTSVFVVYILFVIVFDLGIYAIYVDNISNVLMASILIILPILLIPIGYILSKKAKYKTPVQ